MKNTIRLIAAIVALMACSCSNGETNMPKSAQDYFVALKDAKIDSPSVGLVIEDGPGKLRPNPQALQVLGKELAVAEPEVRDKIIGILVGVGMSVDPQPELWTLRNHEILAILAGPGFAKPDAARDKLMEKLCWSVPMVDLARYGDAFTKALAEKPSENALLLVAKAKPPQAQKVLDQLSQNPNWTDPKPLRIARAALGDTRIEDEFLNEATELEKAGDSWELARALKTLAHIGTPRSLKAVAERLRTPLTIHIVGAFERSVRMEVLDALRYAFPEEYVFKGYVYAEEDYTAAERVCAEKFGVVYDMPTPPFLNHMAYPTPMLE